MTSLESLIFDSNDLAEKLLQGSSALFPTDTLPALAAIPEKADQLWKIKQRPLEKPLILMGASPEILFEWVSPCALDDAWIMAKRHWPGPLTMVLPASGIFVDLLNPGLMTLGMRVPACQRATDLLCKSGPLATTSANLAGTPPSVHPREAAECFPGLPLLGPLPWPSPSGVASTVILWESEGKWKLLREGSLTYEID